MNDTLHVQWCVVCVVLFMSTGELHVGSLPQVNTAKAHGL
jgi:hypothetical protein